MKFYEMTFFSTNNPDVIVTHISSPKKLDLISRLLPRGGSGVPSRFRLRSHKTKNIWVHPADPDKDISFKWEKILGKKTALEQ